MNSIEREYCINIFSRNTLMDPEIRRKQKSLYLSEEFNFEKKVIKLAINEFLYINKLLQSRPVEEVLRLYRHGLMPLVEIMSKKMFAMVFVSNSTNNTRFSSSYSLRIMKKLRKETGIFSLDDVDFRLIIDKDNIDEVVMYDKMAVLYAQFMKLRKEEIVCELPGGCNIEISKSGQMFITM